MFNKLIQFSKTKYRLKFGISLGILILLMTVTAFFIYKNFSVKADIKEPTPPSITLPQISFSERDFFLKIDKIEVSAPIIPDVDGADKEKYFASLQVGVAHMLGTAKPGETGNIVIFGHSNFYDSDPGAYKQVFKNLDKLTTNDKISIRYKGKDYNYIVQRQELVKPEDTWVISAPYNLTLITCWPPGTIEKRLIIFANLES